MVVGRNNPVTACSPERVARVGITSTSCSECGFVSGRSIEWDEEALEMERGDGTILSGKQEQDGLAPSLKRLLRVAAKEGLLDILSVPACFS